MSKKRTGFENADMFYHESFSQKVNGSVHMHCKLEVATDEEIHVAAERWGNKLRKTVAGPGVAFHCKRV
jgi:hypothetical protein